MRKNIYFNINILCIQQPLLQIFVKVLEKFYTSARQSVT